MRWRRATGRSRNCPPRLARCASCWRSPARHQDVDAAAQESDAAGAGSGAGAARPQRRAQQAGTEQRPHRQRARAADARAGARQRLARRRQSAAGSGAGDRVLGALRPRPGGLRRTFGTTAGYYDANGQYARLSPVFDNFKVGPGNTLTPTTAQEGLQGLHPANCVAAPAAARPPRRPTARRRSPTKAAANCDPAQVP